MYTNFFSLSELPFSIAPDPKYLFMSDRHREALTHLNYGLGGSNKEGSNISGTGGFVLLTGEVGTGKTTVSRCLMEDLTENTQLAFILNPTLSSQELLATICDQLKIRYRKTGATLKTLTDKISEKLLKNHANNINTLLIIDEAQHLEAQVLEQLRLLTNLETNTQKLLQVILIGQPELQQLLKRRDLRQLAQRITARYHLLPLNQQELASYIKHRLSVADCHRALFNKGALVAIHKLSQGIPRLINLLCHSALMEAYNSNNAVVDKKIVYRAASHALGGDFDQQPWWQRKSVQMALAGSVFSGVLFVGFWLGQNNSMLEQPNQSATTPPQIAKSDIQVKLQEPAVHEDPIREPKEISVVASNADSQLVVSSEKVDIFEASSQIQEVKVDTSVIAKPEVQELPKDNYQVEAVDGVSDDLLARFQAAVDDTKTSSPSDIKAAQSQTENSEIKSITQMPSWVQEGVPSLRFEQHIYASDGDGWVNVNGRDRYEGDSIASGVVIDKILPQQIILIYRGEKFSLPALTNW